MAHRRLYPSIPFDNSYSSLKYKPCFLVEVLKTIHRKYYLLNESYSLLTLPHSIQYRLAEFNLLDTSEQISLKNIVSSLRQ